MLMSEKLKPVRAWLKDRMHDPDTTQVEAVAAAVHVFGLDDAETLALCEAVGVQYVRVKALS